MPNPVDLRLYLVTDRSLAGPRGVVDTVAAAAAGGATLVQVRSPLATGRAFVEETRALGSLLRPLGIRLIVNDRFDVALAAGADGVHVGQNDIDPRDVRQAIGPDRILGLSVGTPAEWEASRDMLGVVDYLGAGTVFATATKSDTGPAIGLDGLKLIVSRSPLPVVAIGGIDLGNAADCIAAGADGIAVVSAIMAAADPAAAAGALLTEIERSLAARGLNS